MSNFLTDTWKGLPPIAQGVVGVATIGGLTYVGFRQAKKIKDRAELRKQKKLFEQSQKKVAVTDGSGNVVSITINTATAAIKVYDSIHNNDWFGATENEDEIVKTLKAIPKAYIPDVEDKYKILFKKNMRTEVISALGDEWDKVDYLFA